MLIRVIDLETGGFAIADGVCEAAFTQIEYVSDAWQITSEYTTLMNPGKPMNSSAIATHKITDDMVADAISDKHLNKLITWEIDSEPYRTLPVNFVVSHNYSFEAKFVTLESARWICTLACARKIYPGLRHYKNGDVFNHVRHNHNVDPVKCEPAHRALPDTYMTAIILLDMLRKHTPDQLADMTSGKPVGVGMSYGKYKGVKIDEEKIIPAHYLRWVLNESAMHNGHKADAKSELLRRGELLIDPRDNANR